MNGNLDTADVLLNRGLNGGYGYMNGAHGREFANDGSNAVRINSNQKLSTQGHDFLSQQISDNADRNRDTLRTLQSNTQFDRVNDKISDQTDFFNNSIVRVSDSSATAHNEVIREMNANARTAAECCCEAKVLALQNQAALLAGQAEIKAKLDCAAQVADAVANAMQNAKLDTLLAERGRGNGGS